MKQEILDKLKEIELEPENIELSYKEKQNIRCLLCDNIFSATPKSKIANFNNFGKKGCPSCVSNLRYFSSKESNIDKIREKFEIIDDIPLLEFKMSAKLKFKNKICNHIFESTVNNILRRNVNCPVCNAKKKSEFFKTFNNG